ncbi:MAG TPA: methyltransferase domain-containing protein [Spongiibacteraceae bacterium]|nr:methyltransferase domain-containing protein [Spongiibacteraceae bacterium]
MTIKLPWSSALQKLLPTSPGEQPYVVENDNGKSLYFDARNVQSRMRNDAPHDLQLGYTRTMMGFLLLQPLPLDILIVGLGGGSLTKYCHRHLPEATITTVEINSAVIALREQFAIPADSKKFRIICADAAHYLKGKTAIADVILLDGFVDYGLPPTLSDQLFYDNCYNALRNGGVLVANLWAKDATLQRCREFIGQRFANRILTAGAESSKNVIAFALKNPRLPAWPELQRRAQQLQRETGLNFSTFLDEMRGSRHLRNGPARWLTEG